MIIINPSKCEKYNRIDKLHPIEARSYWTYDCLRTSSICQLNTHNFLCLSILLEDSARLFRLSIPSSPFHRLQIKNLPSEKNALPQHAPMAIVHHCHFHRSRSANEQFFGKWGGKTDTKHSPKKPAPSRAMGLGWQACSDRNSILSINNGALAKIRHSFLWQFPHSEDGGLWFSWAIKFFPCTPLPLANHHHKPFEWQQTSRHCDGIIN